MMYRIVLILTIMFLSIPQVNSFASSNDHESLLIKSIQLSGMNEFIDAVPGQIDFSLNQRKLTSSNPEDDEKIANIIKETFSPEQANDDLFNYLLDNSNIELIKSVLNWYESSLAYNITEAENNSQSADAQPEMLRYIADLQTSPPSQERIAIIQRFVREANLTEQSVTLLLAVIEGMTQSINVTMPDDQKKSPEEMQRMIASMRPQLENVLGRQFILSAFYTYREISDANMNKYISFLTSKTGSEFHSLGTEAMSYTLKRAFGRAGKEIAALAIAEADVNE